VTAKRPPAGPVRVFVDARALLGEGPRWDAETGELLWVDISGAAVHVSGPDAGVDRVVHLQRTVTAVAPVDRERLLVVLADGLAVLDRRTGELGDGHTLEQPRGMRLNDAACDSRGRLWAGSMEVGGEAAPGAFLYRVERGEIAVMLDGIGLSNGIGWSPDERRMYFIDSTSQRVDVLDYDAERGTISNRRVLVEIDAGDGVPDGLCVDDAGGIWVALFGGGAVRRYTPAGRLDHAIAVPADNVTACAFGGVVCAQLFITTAAERVAPGRRALQPHAGSVFVVDTRWSGPPARRYRPW
jgi:sugar lactone lactonase YvrE